MGEGPAFAEYVSARQHALLRTAWLLTGDWHAAEDLLQAALVKVWPRWAQIRDEPDAYVRRTLVTTYVSSMRRRWHGERPVEALPDVVPTVDEFAAVDLREALRTTLGGLTPSQRAVLVLRFYEDLSEAQTAAVLGVSIGTVKSQTSKTLARLRTALGEHVQVEG